MATTDEELLKVLKHIDERLKPGGRISGGGAGGGEREYKTRLGALVGGTIDGLDIIIDGLSGFYNQIKKINDAWAKVDASASNYVKTLGATSQAMVRLRKETIDNVVNKGIGVNYNMSTEELLKVQANYAKGVGRNVSVDKGDQEMMAATTAVFGDSATEMGVLFDQFGVGIEGTGKHLEKMFKEASESGISLAKYTDNVKKGLQMAQTYTFKDGLKGMEAMAKRAAAIKMDMETVQAFADSTDSIDKSISTAAKLQTLGGEFAKFADPLGMLSDSLNGVEGSQERLEKMIGDRGHFDKATGEVKVDAFDRRMLKEFSSAVGISFEKTMEIATKKAQRAEIGKQLGSSANGAGLSNEMRELIMNTAQFKDGKAGVSIGGQFKSIDDLSNSDYEALLAETKTEGEDIKDIAKNVRGLVDIREGAVKQFEANQAQISEDTRAGQWEKNITDSIGKANWFLKAISIAVGLIAAKNAISSIIDIGRGIKGLLGKTKIGRAVGNKIAGVKNFVKGKAGQAAKAVGNGIKNVGVRAAEKVGIKAAGKAATETAGKVATEAAGKAAGKAATEAAGKAGANIAKGGVKRTITRAGAAVAGKTGGKIAARLATGVAKGGVLGVVGELGEMAGDALVAKGKIKKGGVTHTAITTASSAAKGAAWGALLGPVGAAVGGVIGGAIGLFKSGKARRERKVDEKLEKAGIQRKGDYGRIQLRKINKALETGEMSDRLRKKLEKNGDTDIIKQIDKVKADKEAKAKEKIDKKLGKKLGRAHFTVMRASFGGAGLRGLGFGVGSLGMGGKIAGKLFKKPTKILGAMLSGNKEKVREAFRGKSSSGYSSTSSIGPSSFNINITGTLNLSSGGQSVNIIDEIRNNPEARRAIAEMVASEMSKQSNGVPVSDNLGQMPQA